MAHWQSIDNAGDGKFMKKITDEEEAEENIERVEKVRACILTISVATSQRSQSLGARCRISNLSLRSPQLYKDGLKAYNGRVDKNKNAPLSPECTFKPRFYTKSGLRDKDTATGRSREIQRQLHSPASKKALNTSGARFTSKSIRSGKKEKKKESTEGSKDVDASLMGLDISADEPLPPPPPTAASPTKSISLDDEMKDELSKLDKEDLLKVVSQLARRDSDLSRMNEFLKKKNDTVRSENSEPMRRDLSDGDGFKTAYASAHNSDGFNTANNSAMNSEDSNDSNEIGDSHVVASHTRSHDNTERDASHNRSCDHDGEEIEMF